MSDFKGIGLVQKGIYSLDSEIGAINGRNSWRSERENERRIREMYSKLTKAQVKEITVANRALEKAFWELEGLLDGAAACAGRPTRADLRKDFQDFLLSFVAGDEIDWGRFRDAYPIDEGARVLIYTRNPGVGVYEIPEAARHPRFVEYEVDSGDSTYDCYTFRTPEGAAQGLYELAQRVSDWSVSREEFDEAIAAIIAANADATPEATS